MAKLQQMNKDLQSACKPGGLTLCERCHDAALAVDKVNAGFGEPAYGVGV